MWHVIWQPFEYQTFMTVRCNLSYAKVSNNIEAVEVLSVSTCCLKPTAAHGHSSLDSSETNGMQNHATEQSESRRMQCRNRSQWACTHVPWSSQSLHSCHLFVKTLLPINSTCGYVRGTSRQNVSQFDVLWLTETRNKKFRFAFSCHIVNN